MDRREQGDEPIPTSVNVFSLPTPPQTMPYVQLSGIKSVQCVTYVPRVRDRVRESHSGFYINVFPWLPWKRGKPIAVDNIFDGERAHILSAKERTLRPPHKPAGDMDNSNFEVLRKQYDNRVALLKELKLNVKRAHKRSLFEKVQD